MKACTKCGKERLLSEYAKRKRGKDGLSSQCKYCLRDLNRSWREQNPEKIRAYGRKYYHSDPDKYIKRAANWAAKNPDKVKGYKSGWYQRNKEKQNMPYLYLTDDYLQKYLKRTNYPQGFLEDPNMVDLKRAELMLKREIRRHKEI